MGKIFIVVQSLKATLSRCSPRQGSDDYFCRQTRVMRFKRFKFYITIYFVFLYMQLLKIYFKSYIYMVQFTMNK